MARFALSEKGERGAELAPPGATGLAVEREVRFVVSAEVVREYLELEILPCRYIRQHFFHREWHEVIAVFTNELSGAETLPADFHPTQLRIRQIDQLGRSSYFLECKGRTPEHNKLERIEISVPIEHSLFAKLLPLASAGCLEKYRFTAPGALLPFPAEQVAVDAEIDLLVSAGGSAVGETDFLLIDVELPSRVYIDDLRAGRHNFPFLFGVKDLALHAKSLRRPLGTQRLARKGFDRKAKTAVTQLLSLTSSL